MKLENFQEKHIGEAAALFQKSYIQLKKDYPYLPDNFGRIETVAAHLKRIIAENPSLVAIRKNRVIGYMAGYSDIKALKGSLSGSYVPEWAHGAISHEKEIYEKLYAAISERWAGKKNYTHIISFLANTELADTFLMLGFGMQVIDAVTAFETGPCLEKMDFTIEPAGMEHLSQLKVLNRKINHHLESAPIFLKRDKGRESDEYMVREFLSEGKITLVALSGKEIISCIRGKVDSGNIPILDGKGTFGIDFGYTEAAYRNTGIASALLREIFAMAKKRGCLYSSVDFESQNIEGRNFWLKHFKPVVYSMMRKIDDRIDLV